MSTNEEETKPESIDEYKDWLKREHDVIIDDFIPVSYTHLTLPTIYSV